MEEAKRPSPSNSTVLMEIYFNICGQIKYKESLFQKAPKDVYHSLLQANIRLHFQFSASENETLSCTGQRKKQIFYD